MFLHRWEDPVDNVVITTGHKQQLYDGKTVENKGKLILMITLMFEKKMRW